jgi:aldose 1-epimerase
MKGHLARSDFGKLPDGTPIHLYTLSNANGLVVKVTNYGTIITEIHVPDRHGKLGDIVLGFDNLAQYLAGHPYFGCTVGRVANYIAKGQFALEGRNYKLAANDGPNHLHGGLKGFDKYAWQATPLKGATIRFAHVSPDGDEGYPGKLSLTVTMSLTNADELRIEYTARTDKPTPINLTNHSYFNLAGQGNILDHQLTVAADFYTPTNEALIPSGEILLVKGTPMDFTRSHAVGENMGRLGHNKGYDHNFVLRGGGQGLSFAARAADPTSGRMLEVFTTEPAVLLYAGGSLDGTCTGKKSQVYHPYAGLCLETQHFPDAVNQPHFPAIILRPGQRWSSMTAYKFCCAE